MIIQDDSRYGFVTGKDVGRINKIDYLIPYDFTPENTVFAGDINGDSAVNSVDIIRALQIAAGQQASGVTVGSDVNKDGKIGVAEALKPR